MASNLSEQCVHSDLDIQSLKKKDLEPLIVILWI